MPRWGLAHSLMPGPEPGNWWGAGAADEAHTAGARSGRSRSQSGEWGEGDPSHCPSPVPGAAAECDHNTGYEWHIVNNSRLGIKTDLLQSPAVSWAVNQPSREYMRLNELTTRRFGVRAF